MRTVLRYLVAVVFISSAVGKLWDFSATAFMLSASTGIGEGAVRGLLSGLIALELALAAGLTMVAVQRRWIDRAAFAIVGSLTVAGVALWLRGADNCGCFGTVISVSPAATLAKNVVLLAFTSWLSATSSASVA